MLLLLASLKVDEIYFNSYIDDKTVLNFISIFWAIASHRAFTLYLFRLVIKRIRNAITNLKSMSLQSLLQNKRLIINYRLKIND